MRTVFVTDSGDHEHIVVVVLYYPLYGLGLGNSIIRYRIIGSSLLKWRGNKSLRLHQL